MSELSEALEELATLLEARRTRKTRKTFLVAAYATLDRKGKPFDPVQVHPGDELYIAKTQQPGAGTISRDASGQLFATALQGLAAGEHSEIKTALYEKLWVTDSNPCEICDENAIAGWIPADEPFPSGDDEPDAHPNCKCTLDVRRTDD